MKINGATEAKNRFLQLLDRAERGEEIVVTRSGKPVVRIGPFYVVPGSADAHHAMKEMRSRAKRIGMSVTIDDIRSWINEGRT